MGRILVSQFRISSTTSDQLRHCLLLAFVFSAILLVGCSGGMQTASPTSPGASIPPTPPTPPTPPPSPTWTPALNTSWQWQLTTPVDFTIPAQMYDIDLFDNDASVVQQLHSLGRKAICYVDVGTWENWRPDAGQFPTLVKGSANGWPGELWLDIRRLDLLGPIITARFQMCKNKGFDGIEPDNVDGYSNSTGFPLTYSDQIAFNKFLAATAHNLGLSVALKNDLEQVQDLLPHFDFALDEQCFEFNECGLLGPFINAGKAVFEVEYNLNSASFCSQANALDFNSLKKNLALDAARTACR